MIFSPRLAALAVLATTLPHGSLAATPSDALEKCTNCKPIYQAIAKCEKIPHPGGIGDAIKNCICVPNSDPSGWYGYLDSCQECLEQNPSGNAQFFDNLATMMSQLLTSCTEPGGNVLSDGVSVCATNAMWSLCASLQDGSSSGAVSWASFEKFSDASQNSNATQLLQLDVPSSGGAATSGSSTAVSSTTAVATGGSSTGAASSATSDGSSSGVTAAPSATPANSTGSGSATSTKSAAPSSSSSAAGLSYGPQAGYVLGMLAAMGVVGSLV